MKRLTLLAAAAVIVAAIACRGDTVAPSRESAAAPTLAVADAYDGGPIHGAIFTTTPNGGIVNENVRYADKREVYLDGGPPGQAPITAAGLPNGLYVFQITDPPGKVLLSDDPAKCRVVQVAGGVIVALVKPADIPAPYGPLSNTYGSGKGTACAIQDAPDGAMGVSGHHDTNTDVDHGAEGAITVQMMPFLDTPNPGGVYKAWMTPLKEYAAKGGKLDAQTKATTVQGKLVGYARDAGFAPPLSKVKTDNFKVKENPPFILIQKFSDLNANQTLDTGDTELIGWPVTVTEPVEGGTVTNEYTTPAGPIGLPQNSTVTVCEEELENWAFSFALVGGAATAATQTVVGTRTFRCVDVTVGTGNTVVIAFGNIKLVPELTIEKTPSSQTVTSGESMAWGIKVSNVGTGKATGVSVTDRLPSLAGGTYTPVPLGCTLAGLDLACAVGDLAAGASKSFVVTLQTTIGQGCSIVYNTANTTGSGGLSAVSQQVSATVTGCGTPLTPGYWKTHEAQTTALLPQTLGRFPVTTFSLAFSVFQAMNCSISSDLDAVGCLAGHLLATKLNFANGAAQPQCAKDAVKSADAFLTGISYLGPTKTYDLTAEQRSTAIAIKDVLDRYNNNGTGTACSF
ncbi:MAG TPA: hypothetical protein VKA84_21420 [Gemmatimonadaceae bacterium]|nr:hypothetical protein [Gemmatimonadaceae bacterium]